MFSTTPRMRCLVILAILAALIAVLAAASWGVVTMIMSAPGIICAIVSAMSPVPGGRSMRRKSGLPQSTSPRNCSMARPSICLLYTSDAADDLLCVDLGGRRIIKKKKKKKQKKKKRKKQGK